MTDLPTGTVTFLLTDVEGSTRMWEQHPQAMSAAIAAHDTAVTSSVESHVGAVVKNRGEGDSTFAVFARPIDAVRAALSLQQRLRSRSASEGPLTARESEIARLLATGLTNRRIAERLVVSVRTVDAHVEHIRNKLGMRNRAEIAAWITHQRAEESELTLRVRCALHTGQAEFRDGDYYGPTVNRCARLRDVAHGGQVLLSRATADGARASLPEATTLRDLGPHRLRDLSEPEQVYQLCHPDLPDDFPPLRSLDLKPTNLPVRLATFVGREDDLSAVRALLGSTRLATLTGPAGVGKTSLATRVAAEVVDRYPDGVWLVELAPVSDPALLIATVAAAIGLGEGAFAGEPHANEGPLFNYLSSRSALIVLDNCEHLVDQCARFAETLLRSCADVSILATSREALGIPGESVWQVPPLSTPNEASGARERLDEFSAVRLFVERAREARAGFELTPDNAGAVVEICRRLEGIPLAIELAAARVPSRTPSEIAERLEDQLKVLIRGSRTADDRQRTMRGAIDWSYDSLDTAQKLLLSRLAVFAGGFTLDAAEAVCTGDGFERDAVDDGLASLVGKSLVQCEAQGDVSRYRLLETIRQYGEHKLRPGALDRLRTHHLEYFVAWLQATSTEAEHDGTLFQQSPRLLDEQHNMRAALKWAEHERRIDCIAKIAGLLYPVWKAGEPSEAVRWLDLGLEAGAELDNDTRARLLTTRAWFSTTAGEGLKAGEFARLAVECWGDRPGFFTAAAYGIRAMMRSWEAAFGSADLRNEVEDFGRRAVALANNEHAKRAALIFVGHARVNVEDFAGAIEAFETASDLGTGQMIWSPESALSVLYHLIGDQRSALNAAEEARAVTWDWGSPDWASYFSLPFALATAAAGRHEEALAFVRDEWESAGSFRVPGVTTGFVIVLAALAGMRGEWDHTAALLAAAQHGALRGPTDLAVLRRYSRDARNALGAEVARRQTQIGSGMSIDDAVLYALEDVRPQLPVT